jgi:AraC-like DNA-binding protein
MMIILILFSLIFAIALAVLYYFYQKVNKRCQALQAQRDAVTHAQDALRSFALEQLVRGNTPQFEQLEAYYRVHGLDFAADAFMLLVVKLRRHPFGDDANGLGAAYAVVREALTRVLGTYVTLYFVELDGLLVCFYSEPRVTLQPEQDTADEEPLLRRLLTQNCEACAASLLEHHGIDVLVALGRYDWGGFVLHSNYLFARSLLEQAMRAKWAGNVVTGTDVPAQKPDMQYVNTQRQFYNCFICLKYEAAAEHLFHMAELRMREYYDSFPAAKEMVANQLRFCTDMLELPLNVRLVLPDGSEITIRDVIRDSGDPASLHRHLTQYFLGLSCRSETAGSQPVPSTERVYRYIQDHYTDELLSVTGLCAQFHLNVSYLSRQFKQEYGLGVLECIHKTRIAKAKELIAAGIQPNDCYARVGYSSRRAFDSAFSRYEGITPKAYQLTLATAS